MKKLTYLFLLIMMVSCGPSETEQLIINYEQKLDAGNEIDLNMKILELDKTGVLTASDSASLYKQEIDSVKRMFFPKDDLDTVSNQYAYESAKELASQFKRLYEVTGKYSNKEKSEQWIELSDNFKNLMDNYSKYKEFQDSVLYEKYYCKYSINNPMMNNAKQTIKKDYLITLDKSKIFTID